MKDLIKNIGNYGYLIPIPAILLIIFRNQFLESSLIISLSKLINLRPQDLLLFFSMLTFLFLDRKIRFACVMFYLIYFFQTH